MKLKLLAIATITAFALASCDTRPKTLASSSETKVVELDGTIGNVYYRELELNGRKYLISQASNGYWIIGPEISHVEAR